MRMIFPPPNRVKLEKMINLHKNTLSLYGDRIKHAGLNIYGLKQGCEKCWYPPHTEKDLYITLIH